jgi:hypothetical protein
MGGTGGGRGTSLLATHPPPVGAAACRLHDVLLPLLQRAIRCIQGGTGCEAIYNIGINTGQYSVADPGCLSQIPDSKFFHPGSWILDPNFSITDYGSASKNLSNPKLFLSFRKYDPGCSSRIWIPIFYPSRILDPRVKKAPDPGPGSATLVQ